MRNITKRISQKLEYFLKRPFIRNVAVVAGGTAVAQTINVAFSPLITRIYGPESFGILGVFMSLVAILKPIAALTYPIAIVLPKEDFEAKVLVKLSLLIAFTVFGVVSIILLMSGESLLKLLDSEAIAPYIFLVPISMLFSAFEQICKQWLIRKKQFSITAKVAIIQAFLVNTAKTGIGLVKPLGVILIILATLGNGLHALLLGAGIKKSESFKTSSALKEEYKTSFTRLATTYFDFPLYRAPQTLFNAFAQSLPVLLLASFFGPSAAGFFALGVRVLSLPITLISQSIGNVFYPRIAQAANDGENLQRLILKATIGLLLIGVIPFGTVFVFGPRLFIFVFGGDWGRAGEYARWLSLWLLFRFANNPCVVAVPVLRLQRWFLFFEIASMTSRILAFCLGYLLFKSDLIAVALFSAVGASFYAWFLINVILESARNRKTDT